MKIVLNNIEPFYITIFKSVKNTHISQGYFSKIHYSTPLFTCKNITTSFNIKPYRYSKHFNKYTYFFKYDDNKSVINRIIDIESKILEFYKTEQNSNIYPIYNIKKILLSNSYSCDTKSNNLLIIYGIWENDNKCGLSFKIV